MGDQESGQIRGGGGRLWREGASVVASSDAILSSCASHGGEE